MGYIFAFMVGDFVPVEMIQSGKLIGKLFRFVTDVFRFFHFCYSRHVAKSDGLFPPKLFDGGFRDHSTGIGEIDKPCIWAKLFHIFNNLTNYRNGTEGFHHSTGTICFLPKHSVQIRDAFIFDPCFQKTYTELGCHKICICKGFSAI